MTPFWKSLESLESKNLAKTEKSSHYSARIVTGKNVEYAWK